MQAATRRRIAMISVAIIVAIALAYGFMPKTQSVDMVTVSKGKLRVTVEEEGKTRVIDRFVISAPVAGYMQRILLDTGNPVSKGQTVAVLEPLRSSVLDPRSRAEAEANIKAASAALKAAEEQEKAAIADEEFARSSYERSKKLYESGYIAREGLEESKARAERTRAQSLSAHASTEAARSALERARTSLRYSAAEPVPSITEKVTVISPVSGRVLKIHRESAGTVNSGDPLIDIGDPHALEIETEVLTADAVNIKPGMPVEFKRWGGDAPLEGRVKTVEPAGFTKISSLGVEEQRVLVISEITSLPETWKQLGDRYRVEASFIIWQGDNILRAPESALFRTKDGWAVFVTEKGRARLRPVQPGRRNGMTAEIVSGLSEGESVIIHPSETISDGSRVRQRKTP